MLPALIADFLMLTLLLAFARVGTMFLVKRDPDSPLSKAAAFIYA